MRLKVFFVHLFFQKKDEKYTISNPDPALICVDQSERYELLSEVDTLSNASTIMAKGVWNDQDFIILRDKFRATLPSCVANVVLREVDMSDVKLDPSCDSIDLRGLFNFCVNLTNVSLPDATHFEGKVCFRSTFRGCSKLRELYNLATYRRISDLSGTFCYCTVLSSLELYAEPFPYGDSETFRKVNRNIRIMVPSGIRIPSDWSQLTLENIVFKDRLLCESLYSK